LFSAAIIASVGVSSSVGWLNRIIFPRTVFYNEIFAGHAHKYGLMILFIAVLPAVLEELAYRGYILQQLLKVVDSRQAVYITSFLFAIAHLSFLSLFWLIPFSLLLGYIRVKNNTLWYGIGIHFFFNLTACLIDFI
jgi:membrane protease YdiL (CAAX protease family)